MTAATVDHLATAMERMEAMRRTGLAQAFTAANGAAVLDEIERLRRERDDFEQRLHAYKSGEIA